MDQKIKDIIPNPKDRLVVEDQGIFKIPCHDQTKHRIRTTTDENKKAVGQKTIISSQVQQAVNTCHKRSANISAKILKEAIEIVR